MATKIALPIVLLLLATACSKGGGDERPTSEVTISASHQMFGSRGRPLFNKFPVDPAFMLSDRGTLILKDDNTYTVGNSAPQGYAIGKDGSFTVTVPVAGRPAPTHFVGAYSLEGDTQVYFFTDRFATNSNEAVGLIWGTRQTTAMADLEGDWHVFSQHVIFAPPMSSQVAGNVGRTMAGTIAIDAAGDITGSGKESTTTNLTFTGSVTDIAANGAVTLELDYTEGTNKDTREFHAGTSNAIILGLDEEENDGETGLIGLLRKRTGSKDLTMLAGTYTVGMHTIFVNPVRAGIDGATGTITFDDKDTFELKATGQQAGQPSAFTYTGKYTMADDGTLTLTVPDTQETWMGAVDQDYKVLLIADNFVEARIGTELPELNLILGIREPADTSK